MHAQWKNNRVGSGQKQLNCILKTAKQKRREEKGEAGVTTKWGMKRTRGRREENKREGNDRHVEMEGERERED